MLQRESFRLKDHLISKISISALPTKRSEVRSTNFSKYNRKYLSPSSSNSYMQNLRSFRNTRAEKFKKHSNLVQTNKENIMRLHTPKPKKEFWQTTLPLKTQPIPPNNRWSEVSNLYYKPRTGQQFAVEETSDNLQNLLHKNGLKSSRNLLGFNILQLQKQYNFSRFQLHTLYSIYKTLLYDSRNSIARFKGSFEVMLNMNKISIRPEELDRIFMEQSEITFESFIEMYGKIDKAIVKESIIDYVRILFEGVYDQDRVRFQDIIRILKNRITEKEAFDIAKIIFEQIDRDFDDGVKLTEVLELCLSCQNFSKKMYRIYAKEVKLD